jgi:hypothetical protein
VGGLRSPLVAAEYEERHAVGKMLGRRGLNVYSFQ